MKLLELVCVRMVFIVVGTIMFVSAHAAENKPAQFSQVQFEKLDTLYSKFSARIHRKLLQKNLFNSQAFSHIKELNSAVAHYRSSGDNITAVNLIIKNIPLLENNYDNLYILEFITLLLDQNERQSANILYNIIKSEGDNTLITTASYLFAQYHFKRQQWQSTINLLTEAINNLPFEDQNNALLMMGISLQNLLKHRESITYYQNITKDSRYYLTAQLNMATAYMRQGWWTDAHNVITKLLRSQQTSIPEPSLNRLYLFLGYLFLNQEYYRDSREAFRNVSQDSRYTNKALLGISLSAANQEDYIGALNAARILKEQKVYDLTVAESYLLAPYYYEKINQHRTASSGYTEAIAYYQNRINNINNLIAQDLEINAAMINQHNIYTINGIELNLTEAHPAQLLVNYQQLEQYRAYVAKLADNSLREDFNKIYDSYERALTKIIRQKLTTRIQQLTSYMDQSRYGLARLYDNNMAQQQ